MKIAKYAIYDYWKDKAITKNFEVKLAANCTPDEQAVKITEFPDEIFCWACRQPPLRTYDKGDIKSLWNHDRLLTKAHILPKSKGGEDTPANLFLLCPDCHTAAPDTTNPKNFFGWVYYKRNHENWVQVYNEELKKAAAIKGIAIETISARCRQIDLDFDKIMLLREEIGKRCAMHGMSMSLSSKMMSFIDILMEKDL